LGGTEVAEAELVLGDPKAELVLGDPKAELVLGCYRSNRP
jgi:hypothetical protein